MLDLLGKHYALGSRGPLYFDCYGLCQEVLKRRGINIPDFESTEEIEKRHSQILTEAQKPFWREISHPAPWCLVTFMLIPPYTSHIGVVLEDCKTFIHIMSKRRVCIERLDSFVWAKRITGYYAIN